MSYSVRFPGHSIEKNFGKVLLNISQKGLQDEIVRSVNNLAVKPRPFGEKPFKKLKPPVQFYQFTAQCRIRIGDYRVLYDIDDNKRIVWILALRRRSEKTYR